MHTPDDVLIVGGYGVVGRLIVQKLASELAGRLLIGGRSRGKAEHACRLLGHGARARVIDLDDPSTLESALAGVGTVIACVAQAKPHLLHAAALKGLAYTDLSPRLAFLSGLEQLEQTARRTGARLLLGTGLSPGVSNVMARQLANELGTIDTIQTTILLSLGDSYGPDSLHHVFESLKQPFTVHEAGRTRSVRPFGRPRPIDFPAPMGACMTYEFPWSDVTSYPRTLGARTAVGRIALDPAWLGRAGGMVEQLHMLPLLGRSSLGSENSRALSWLKRRYRERDGFALIVDAAAAGNRRRMTLVGRRQAEVTAASAAEMLRMLATGEIGTAGLWFAEQVISPQSFFTALSRAGWHVQSSP